MANISATITPLSTYFSDNENKSEAYGKWVKYMKSVCTAYGIVDVARTKAMLMVSGGEELAVLDIPDFVPTAAQLVINQNYVETFDELATRIGMYYPARPTPYLNSFKLHATRQLENETTRDFANRLLKLARKCTFTDRATIIEQQQQVVLNCICTGTSNNKLQTNMLNMNVATTLNEILEMGTTLESVATQVTQLALLKESNTIARINVYEKPKCTNCGNKHQTNEYCPATGIKCFNCNTIGHFKYYCKEPVKMQSNGLTKSQSSNEITSKKSTVTTQRPGYLNNNNRRNSSTHQNQITANDGYEPPPTHKQPSQQQPQANDMLFQNYFDNIYNNQYVLNVNENNIQVKGPECEYMLNGHLVQGILDTGAGRTTQTLKSYSEMTQQPKLNKYYGQAYAFGSKEPIPILGCYSASVTNKFNKLAWTTLVLVVAVGDNILDNVSCQALKLVVIVNRVKVSNENSNRIVDVKVNSQNVYGESVESGQSQSQSQSQSKNSQYKNNKIVNTKENNTNNSDKLKTISINGMPIANNNCTSMSNYSIVDQVCFKNKAIAAHPKLFKIGAIGKFNGYEAKLHINYDIKYSRCSHDRTPIFLRPIVKAEVDEMIKLDLAERLPPNTPTTWVVPTRVVPKKGGSGWRVTLNMVKPNQAIIRTQHVMMTVEDVRLKVAGATWITKFDMNKAYQQIVVREEDRHMMTFATYEGLFRSKRLLFGVASASEIFDNIVSETLSDVECATNISDDVLTWGSDSSHDTNVEKTMTKMENAGFTFNAEKCIFKQRQVNYFGRTISGFGIAPTDENIKALVEANRPKTAAEVKSFLGVVNWNTAFVPNLATLAEPLNELTKSYTWNEKHEQCFIKLKACLTSKPLKHFNKNWYTKLVVDASPIGLGAILIQIDPITGEIWVCFYCSRICTYVEGRYSQVEREFLGCKWALLKFRMYLLGRKFTLITDNKPVQQMLQNPQAKVTNERIQRMMDKLPKYDMVVEYIKSDLNPADYFSRNPIQPTASELIEINKHADSIERKILQVSIDAAPPSLAITKVAQATKENQILQAVIKTINAPFDIKNLEEVVKPYKDILNDIVMFNGVLIVKNKLIIPSTLQSELIKLAHEGHQGVKRTYELLKLNAWFPNMKKRVEDTLKSCACYSYNKKSVRTTVFMSIMPLGPMNTLACDYKGPLANGNMLFLAICMYSRYPFAAEVPSTSFNNIKKVLDNIFSMFGYCVMIMSDNGPPFTSIEFEQYCKERHIKHHLVTPLWPNANGMIEKFIKNIVKVIEIAKIENKPLKTELDKFMLTYRATPHSTTNASPAKMFFNREIITKLPQLTIEPPKTDANHQAELQNKYNQAKIATYANVVKHVVANHNLIKDDIVQIVKKVNAFKANRFDSEMYKVLETRGSAIAVKSLVDGSEKVRNCFHVCFISRPCKQDLPRQQLDKFTKQETIKTTTKEDGQVKTHSQHNKSPSVIIDPHKNNKVSIDTNKNLNLNLQISIPCDIRPPPPPPPPPLPPHRVLITPPQTPGIALQNQFNILNHDQQQHNTSSSESNSNSSSTTDEENNEENNAIMIHQTRSPSPPPQNSTSLSRMSRSNNEKKTQNKKREASGSRSSRSSDNMELDETVVARQRPHRTTRPPNRLTVTEFCKATKPYN
jgi:hypothetical protein